MFENQKGLPAWPPSKVMLTELIDLSSPLAIRFGAILRLHLLRFREVISRSFWVVQCISYLVVSFPDSVIKCDPRGSICCLLLPLLCVCVGKRLLGFGATRVLCTVEIAESYKELWFIGTVSVNTVYSNHLCIIN